MWLSKNIIPTKALALAWALLLCMFNITAQNKVGIIKNTQLYEAGGGGFVIKMVKLELVLRAIIFFQVLLAVL
jgi:hypothetical protein